MYCMSTKSGVAGNIFFESHACIPVMRLHTSGNLLKFTRVGRKGPMARTTDVRKSGVYSKILHGRMLRSRMKLCCL